MKKIIVFGSVAVIISVCLVLFQSIANFQLNFFLYHAFNALMCFSSVVTSFISDRAKKDSNTYRFVQTVSSNTFIKFILIIGFVLTILLTEAIKVELTDVLGMFVLYFVYAFIEVKLQLSFYKT